MQVRSEELWNVILVIWFQMFLFSIYAKYDSAGIFAVLFLSSVSILKQTRKSVIFGPSWRYSGLQHGRISYTSDCLPWISFRSSSVASSLYILVFVWTSCWLPVWAHGYGASAWHQQHLKEDAPWTFRLSRIFNSLSLFAYLFSSMSSVCLFVFFFFCGGWVGGVAGVASFTCPWPVLFGFVVFWSVLFLCTTAAILRNSNTS